MAERFRATPLWLLPSLVTAILGVLAWVMLLGPSLAADAPALASTRTDPLGSSALFNAYAATGLRLVRSYDGRSLDDLNPAASTAFVLQPQAWPDGLAARLLNFAHAGGAVVLAGLTPPPPPGATRPASPAGLGAPPALAQLLGIKLRAAQQERPEAMATLPMRSASRSARLRPMPLVHPEEGLLLPPGWTPLFVQRGLVYAARKMIGQGQVIVTSEATFLSNDNLRQAADPDLLSWLVEGRTTVWVDETTHGLSDDPGTAWLLRRYHLRTAVLLLLAGLGLAGWALAAALEQPPARASEAADEEKVALPATAGLARLLQRALPPRELPAELRRRLEHDDPEVVARLPAAPSGADEDAILDYYRLAVRLRKEHV